MHVITHRVVCRCRYVQAELVHARLAMAGVAGILFTSVSGLCSLQRCL